MRSSRYRFKLTALSKTSSTILERSKSERQDFFLKLKGISCLAGQFVGPCTWAGWPLSINQFGQGCGQIRYSSPSKLPPRPPAVLPNTQQRYLAEPPLPLQTEPRL